MRIKAIVTIALVALFALVGLGATQTTHASTEIWSQYCRDTKAMKGTFVTLICQFGKTKNTYSYGSDGVDVTDSIPLAIGKYKLTLPHLVIKINHNYEFVMQKTEGGNQPNFYLATPSTQVGFDEWERFIDLEDHDIHTQSFIFHIYAKSESPTWIEGWFGSHTSGTEKIEGYLRDLDA